MAARTSIVAAFLTAPDDAQPRVAAVAMPVDDIVVGVLDAAPLVAITFLAFLRGGKDMSEPDSMEVRRMGAFWEIQSHECGDGSRGTEAG